MGLYTHTHVNVIKKILIFSCTILRVSGPKLMIFFQALFNKLRM